MESASAAEEPDTEDSGLISLDNLSVQLGAQVHFVVCVPALPKSLFALQIKQLQLCKNMFATLGQIL